MPKHFSMICPTDAIGRRVYITRGPYHGMSGIVVDYCHPTGDYTLDILQLYKIRVEGNDIRLMDNE